MVNTQFQDPAVKEVYEKKMFDLWMGNMPATHYFQELEKEAKLAGLRNNEQEHGAMVKAKGSSTTPTSNRNAGGVTSLTLAKPAGNTTSHDAGSGRWTTYGGAGQPMNIDRLRAEGRCFRCKEKGHLGKDCPKKQEHKDICLVIAAEQEQKMESKVKEIEECNNDNDMTTDLCLWDDGHDAGDTVATTGRPSRRDTSGPLKSKQPSPPSAQAKVVEPAGHRAKSLPKEERNVPKTSNLRAGEVKPVIPFGNGASIQTDHTLLSTLLGNAHDGAQKKTAKGQEAVSVQTVKRGHKVTLIEVPNEEDDTSFVLYQRKVAATDADACRPSLKRESPLKEREAEHPISNDPLRSEDQEAVKHMPPMVQTRWLKPFEVDWTLRAIQGARNNNATHAVLFVWGGKTAQEQLYKLREPVHYIRGT
ncbi:uncharacterized protein ARMOST_03204 [Armillaria ostoyae]|uniref:CCHC-type domain-containing protein n=1 Tax=Armillaria ostoyae TaxID=47428 RepID=A0A284QTZ3_ARMOS|nr:uncharacterized protein ARMOST_03204 [Armillaria ostoyae]